MKFNVKLAASEQDYLEKQYKEYIEKTTMTDKERNALKEWVMDGNSPYDNPMGLWKDSFHPVEFLEVYRDEEYMLLNVADPKKYNDEVIYPDKVRLNLYYLHHYSFWKDIEMIVCTVLGRKMNYGGEQI